MTTKNPYENWYEVYERGEVIALFRDRDEAENYLYSCDELLGHEKYEKLQMKIMQNGKLILDKLW